MKSVEISDLSMKPYPGIVVEITNTEFTTVEFGKKTIRKIDEVNPDVVKILNTKVEPLYYINKDEFPNYFGKDKN